MGISYNEYLQLAAAQGPGISSYTATGGSLSVAAGLSQPMPIETHCLYNILWTLLTELTGAVSMMITARTLSSSTASGGSLSVAAGLTVHIHADCTCLLSKAESAADRSVRDCDLDIAVPSSFLPLQAFAGICKLPNS